MGHSGLSRHADRLWSHAARRKEVNHKASRKRLSVYWTIRKEDWIALRWCHITEYASGVIRFTSRIEPYPPKRLWPVQGMKYYERRLEITLAASELDESKYERLAEIFSYPEKALDWELLQEVASDTNLWSDAAVAAAEQVRNRRRV